MTIGELCFPARINIIEKYEAGKYFSIESVCITLVWLRVIALD